MPNGKKKRREAVQKDCLSECRKKRNNRREKKQLLCPDNGDGLKGKKKKKRRGKGAQSSFCWSPRRVGRAARIVTAEWRGGKKEKKGMRFRGAIAGIGRMFESSRKKKQAQTS